MLGKLPTTWKKTHKVWVTCCHVPWHFWFYILIPEFINSQNQEKQTCECFLYRVQRIKTKNLAEQWFSMWTIAAAAAFMTEYVV